MSAEPTPDRRILPNPVGPNAEFYAYGRARRAATAALRRLRHVAPSAAPSLRGVRLAREHVGAGQRARARLLVDDHAPAARSRVRSAVRGRRRRARGRSAARRQPPRHRAGRARARPCRSKPCSNRSPTPSRSCTSARPRNLRGMELWELVAREAIRETRGELRALRRQRPLRRRRRPVHGRRRARGEGS